MTSTTFSTYVKGKSTAATPAYLWLVAALVGSLAGIAVCFPLALAGTVCLVIVVALFNAIYRVPLRGFLALLAVYPYYAAFRGIAGLYGIPLPGVLGMWPEAVLTCMLVSLVVRAVRGGARLQLTAVDIPVFILLLSGIYGLVISIIDSSLVAGMYGFHTSLSPFCFYFVARWLKVSANDMRRVLRWWLLHFTIIALISLYDYFLRPDFFIRLAIQVRTNYWGLNDPVVFFHWYPRMQSLLYAEQLWGTLCALVFLFGITTIGSLRRGRDLFARLLVTLIALLCVILSMSRGAQVCLAVALLALLCLRGRHRPILLSLVLLGSFALILLPKTGKQAERLSVLAGRLQDLTEVGDTKNSAYDRVEQWQHALEEFPLFPAGRGLGRVGASGLTHNTSDSGHFVADGGYFKILAEQGIPGMLLFVVAVFWIPFPLYQLFRDLTGEDKALAATLLCFYCGLLVQSIAANVFDLWYLQHVFWMFFGLLVARKQQILPEKRFSLRKYLSRFRSSGTPPCRTS